MSTQHVYFHLINELNVEMMRSYNCEFHCDALCRLAERQIPESPEALSHLSGSRDVGDVWRHSVDFTYESINPCRLLHVFVPMKFRVGLQLRVTFSVTGVKEHSMEKTGISSLES